MVFERPSIAEKPFTMFSRPRCARAAQNYVGLLSDVRPFKTISPSKVALLVYYYYIVIIYQSRDFGGRYRNIYYGTYNNNTFLTSYNSDLIERHHPISNTIQIRHFFFVKTVIYFLLSPSPHLKIP